MQKNSTMTATFDEKMCTSSSRRAVPSFSNDAGRILSLSGAPKHLLERNERQGHAHVARTND